MTNACTRRGPIFNRRQMLATGALAFGGIGFGTPLLAQDIQLGGEPDATPTAPPIPTTAPPAGETVNEVAIRLGYDREALIAFVRDEIRYEPYTGILRGANGTLRARAGNSADQAVLLGALFEASQLEHRFATGMLDAAGEAALTGLQARTREETMAAWEAADTAALLHHLGLNELPATPPAPDPTVEAQMRDAEATTRQAVDRALAAIDVSTGAIADALASGGIALPALETSLPGSERLHHVWVQIPDGPNWIDIDPSLPDGVASPEVVETPETPPDDWRHWLRFVIAADEWRAGSMRQREVVSLSAASARLVDVPVALSMASADELTATGQTITQGLTGQKTIFPSIYADGVTVNASVPLVFATDAGSGNPFGEAGAAGLGEGETIAVWLRVEITSPGAETIVVERPLLDRVPPEDRAVNIIEPERIQPLRLVPTEIGDDTLEQFNVLSIIHTDVARIPVVDAFVRYSQDEVFGALGVLGPAVAGFRDTLGATLEAEAGFWSFPSGPNLTVFHAGAPDEQGRATLTADLLYRQRTSLPMVDAQPSGEVHPLVLSGVLDAVAEQLLLSPETRGERAEAPSVDAGPAIATIFAEADAAGVPVRIVTRVDDLAAINADPLSQRRMEMALAAGQVVIVPETSVEVSGTPVLGWWIVDPATGRTTDQLQDGTGGAMTGVRVLPSVLFGSNAPGYTFLQRAIAWFASRGRAFACMGAGIAVGFFIAVFIIGATSGLSQPLGGLLVVGGLAGASTSGGVAKWACAG